MATPAHIEESATLWQRGVDESFALPSPDGFTIHGTLNKALSTAPSRKLAIFAHGMTGHSSEYIFMTARDFFTTRGYDVVRFEFYCSEPHARSLRDCLLQTYVQDLQQVIAHFRKDYDSIFVAGHSYGGMTALVANPDINAISLWDSSLYPYKEYWERESRYIPELECYSVYAGINALVGKAMIEESLTYDLEKMRAIAEDLNVPTQLVVAAEHVKRPGQKMVFDMITAPKDYTEIKGAHHDFCDNDTAQDLMTKTWEWFERF